MKYLQNTLYQQLLDFRYYLLDWICLVLHELMSLFRWTKDGKYV